MVGCLENGKFPIKRQIAANFLRNGKVAGDAL